jgi:hypothetical protein
MIVGDFHTPLSAKDKPSKQKINKRIRKLNFTIDQMNLTDIYRISHPASAEYPTLLTST